MAERRMISKSVARTDAFLSMPLAAQALYFHLNLEADDDGFVSNPTTVIRMIGARSKDLTALINAQYIIDLGDRIIVIRHWHQNNYLRKDRYKSTIHQSVKKLLETDINDVYQLRDSKTSNNSELLKDERYTDMATVGIPNGNQMATQYSIGKDSIDKDSIDKDSIDKDSVVEYSNAPTASQTPTVHTPPSFSEVEEYCKGKNVDAEKFYKNYEAAGWKVKDGRPITDWKALVNNWDKTERPKPEPAPEHKPAYDLDEYEKYDIFSDPRNEHLFTQED